MILHDSSISERKGRFRKKKVLKSWGLEKYKNNELRRISGQKVSPKRQWIKLQRFFYSKSGAQNVSNTIAGSMRTKETARRLHTMPDLLMGQNVRARSSHLQPTHWHSITFFVLTCSQSVTKPTALARQLKMSVFLSIRCYTVIVPCILFKASIFLHNFDLQQIQVCYW